MKEEEIEQKFKETYPDLMRGNEPLSPYFDIWCYAIEIMEEQMEKMKCCQNCEHHFYNGLFYICCNLHEPKGEPLTSVRCCPNWKLKEVAE